MEYAFSLERLVNAGSGLLWVTLGAVAFAMKPQAPGGRALAWLLVAFGGRFVAANTLNAARDASGSLVPLVVGLVCDVALVVLGVVVALRFPTRLPGRRVMELAAAGILLLAIAILASVYAFPEVAADTGLRFFSLEAHVVDDFLTNLSFSATILAVIALAIRVRTEPPRDERARGGWVTLIFGVSLYFVYGLGRFVPGPDVPRASLQAGGILIVLWVVAGTTGAASRVARTLTLLLVAVVLTGVTTLVLAPGTSGKIGDVGIVRTIGAAIVAHAIFRGDILRLGRRSRLAGRGALATASLAALLVVAQVAQNFLAAEYGLLMGGVVAGAFLFAATPIQRAIESRRGSDHASPASSVANQEMYRKALRVALHDGAMTRDEERHLAALAADLGVSYRDALGLRDEVESEYAKKARAPSLRHA